MRVSYSALIVVLVRWRPVRAPRALPRETLGDAMGAGHALCRHVAQHQQGAAARLLFGLAAIAVLALMPLVARDLVQGGPLTYGVLLGAFGDRRGRRGACSAPGCADASRSNGSCAGAFAGFAVCAPSRGAERHAWLTVAGMAARRRLLGAGAGALQRHRAAVDAALGGRPGALALSDGDLRRHGAGQLDLGRASPSATGPAMRCCLAAACMLAGGADRLRLPLPEPTTLEPRPAQPLDGAARSRIDIKPRSGPIVITIEYMIREEDVPEFLAVMAERRRVRRRDGARHWTLLRDLEDPEFWMERYHTPDLARLHPPQPAHHAGRRRSRRADQSAARGPKPPRVHRMIERQTGSLPAPFPSESQETSL